MSGICGICEPGADLSRQSLAPMLTATAVSGELPPEGLSGRAAAMGVVRRWPFQQIAEISGVRIAVDADLYNLKPLTDFLGGQGLDPSSMSLAEQLARLYVLRGERFVEQLEGAFSLAIWDENKQRLILAIDRLGLKGLYWCQEASRLLFATRARAICAVQGRPTEVDPAAVMQFLLFSVVPAPLCIYRRLEKLRPGYLLAYQNGQVRQTRYWDLDYAESENHNVGHWAERVQQAMRSAVHLNLENCAPEQTGAYLSGGTDSSSVVAFINERCSPVNTFSIAFQESTYSEIEFARTISRRFKTNHHELRLAPEDAYQAIPKITQYYDEPFANSSAIGAYCCARMARERGCDTLLAGDGGDELFAGNERYASDKYFSIYHSVPRWFRRGVLEPVAGLLPAEDGWLSLPRRYIRRALIPNPRRILSYSLFLSIRPEEAFETGFLEQVAPETWLAIAEEHFRTARARTELNRLLYLDVKVTLADNDIRKVSGTAELAGVRVRYPLLDYRLAELTGTIPSDLKLRGFEKRYIFKQAMEGILPDQVLYKKKHGFGVPLGLWFLKDPRLNSLVQDILTDPRTRQRGYFRPEFFDKLTDLHRQDHVAFYGEALWYLIVLELWHREHLEGPRGESGAN
jgi:asparagine synthase (glutamine-hydrolysing)